MTTIDFLFFRFSIITRCFYLEFEVLFQLVFIFFTGCYQGEVEQISLMKPKAQGPHDEGFLEYLEDIIGTNRYVEKIDESSKE